jgi:hypothetical protein
MTDPTNKRPGRTAPPLPRRARAADTARADQPHASLCWPFPAGSQNNTDKAVTLKPYVPPKRRTLNTY